MPKKSYVDKYQPESNMVISDISDDSDDQDQKIEIDSKLMNNLDKIINKGLKEPSTLVSDNFSDFEDNDDDYSSSELDSEEGDIPTPEFKKSLYSDDYNDEVEEKEIVVKKPISKAVEPQKYKDEVFKQKDQKISNVDEKNKQVKKSTSKLSAANKKAPASNRYATIRKALNMNRNIEEQFDILMEKDDMFVEKSKAKVDGEKSSVYVKDGISRKDIIAQFFFRERSYIECTYVCNMFRKAIYKSGGVPETAILNPADYKTLFMNIDQISTFHAVWQPLVENKIRTEGNDILVADFFISLLERLPLYRSLMQNYDNMLEIIVRNRSIETFNSMLSKQISIVNSKESLSFEGILAKMNNRMSYYLMSLDEIMRYTPETHSEYSSLKKIRTDIAIFFEILLLNREKKIFGRDISRTAALVELVGDKKKNRLLFVYSDILVLAAENSKKNTINLRWYSPMKKTKIIDNFKPNIRYETQSEVEKLKALISNNRNLLKNEYIQPKRKTQYIEKLERTINTLEMNLIYALAIHPLVISSIGGKNIILLFSSKREADEWHSAIDARINYPLMEEWSISSSEIQAKLDNICKQVDKVAESLTDRNAGNNNDNAVLSEIFTTPNKNESLVTGALKIKYILQNGIGNANMRTNDCYFDIEIDSFNYFFKQYKSKPVKPFESANEVVKMSVEKCSTLRFQFYFGKSDKAVEKFDVKLVEGQLKDKSYICERKIVYNAAKIVIFIEYASTIQKFEKIMTPVDLINHFMVNVSNITSTEHSDIPTVVRICCETVEERGIDVVGIYRISGVSSQVANLKKEWENHMITCVQDLDDYDIHVVSGLLKMFFRDLDEKLIPTPSTTHFLNWFKLPFESRTHDALLDIVASLSVINCRVFEYLIRHILRIAKKSDVNKMTLSNLSTVFGPNIFSEKGVNTSDGVLLIVSLCKEILDSYSRNQKFYLSD